MKEEKTKKKLSKKDIVIIVSIFTALVAGYTIGRFVNIKRSRDHSDEINRLKGSLEILLEDKKKRDRLINELVYQLGKSRAEKIIKKFQI